MRHINETHAGCWVPGHTVPKIVPIALKTINGDYFGGYLSNLEGILEYSNITYFWATDPPEGPVSGSNTTILGNFSRLGNDPIRVFFGGKEVTGIYNRTKDTMLVTTPSIVLDPGEDRRKVNITIHWVAGGFTMQNQTVIYEYKNYSTLVSIWPVHGPANGGTMIQVEGLDFDTESKCLLRNGIEIILIDAYLVSKQLLICETPTHEPGIFEFALSFAENAVVITNNLTFTFDPDAHILGLYPAHVSLRAYEMNIRVNVSGLHFRNTTGLTIEVGHWRQDATYVNPTLLIFTPPPVRETGRYPLWVSLNDLDFTKSSSPLYLTYHGDFIVRSTSLTRVQIADNRENVDIIIYG